MPGGEKPTATTDPGKFQGLEASGSTEGGGDENAADPRCINGNTLRDRIPRCLFSFTQLVSCPSLALEETEKVVKKSPIKMKLGTGGHRTHWSWKRGQHWKKALGDHLHAKRWNTWAMPSPRGPRLQTARTVFYLAGEGRTSFRRIHQSERKHFKSTHLVPIVCSQCFRTSLWNWVIASD